MTKKLNALHNGFKPQTVSFPSSDGTVVGHLYVPKDYSASHQYLAAVIGGSFSSVKEQMSGIYAGEMARRGIIGLAIDYRNYGESSGKIRQFEDPESKATDILAARTYLQHRQDISAVGLLGICTSGTTVLQAAAADPSVEAVATVAGSFFEPSLFNGVEKKHAAAKAARTKYEQTGIVDMIPAYHPINPKAVNTVPMPYYLSKQRGNVTQWRNEMAVMAWDAFLTTDAITNAAKVIAPTLIVHSKMAAYPAQASKVYEQLAGPKQLIWDKGQHFSFYDHPKQVRQAANQVAEHFKKTLTNQ
ncbi:alpha/beta hydrolase [Lactobacillus sp. CBA3605]|uniref:alpha/beta hydrolase n=1 Tax=Lactobacillus sp. CBA3605 TaxID=2099788 RepID=UPI000CFCF29C|nr:alpha/beta hydrolase [Lactobacillus sp. CBA3605]AVK62208.1 alpha/beta hydrolase [Lactobacillus sp. CBA3605]